MVWDKYNRSNGGVTIDFYPNTLDNIFWSKEGIIAVGGSDHVSLFVSLMIPPHYLIQLTFLGTTSQSYRIR